MNAFEKELAERLRPQFEAVKDEEPEKIFRIGWLCGFQRAVEIESQHYTGKGRKPKDGK
jgi:hypothetical protein